MKFNIKLIITIFLASQMVLFLLSFILYRNISLLHYINLSFYISFIQLSFSLMVFTVNTGFFDITARSFRVMFSGKHTTKEEIKEMTPLSQIFSFNYFPILISGIINLLFMLIGLYLYYI
jgi:hypothetical protein